MNPLTPLTLNLHDPVKLGNHSLANVTDIFAPTWRRSIARIMGFKIGTVELTTKEISPNEMSDFFQFGLLREIREIAGGVLTWQGMVAAMEWTHQGDVFTIDLNNLYNARRALYRRLFDNLLINGSAESGAWTAYNGATVTQSIEWVADGTYSCKIIVADAVKRGAIIQTGITIVAEVAYVFMGHMRVLSGSCAVEAYRSDNNVRLVRFDSAGQIGDVIASFTIPATNTYAGNIYIRASSIPAAGPCTFYMDGCVFKLADAAADTGWQVDANSAAIYGRKEWIDLWGGLSYQAANAHVAKDLIDTAWPQPDVPGQGITRQRAIDPKEDRLSITFAGYWITLNWIYTRLTSAGASSALVRTLLGYQSEYLSAGAIATNSLSYSIEDSNPLRVGDVLKEIADSSDASGNRWSIGVYADRRLDYQPVAAELTYHLRGGHLYQTAGGDIEPWFARPGWAQVDELPIGPGAHTSQTRNNPRWRYLEEIEMMPPDNDHPDYWLSYNREAT